MKKLEDMTPIELKHLIDKNVEKHNLIKKEIIDYTFEVDKIKNKIDEGFDKLKGLENEYVELMGVLMSKQGMPEPKEN